MTRSTRATPAGDKRPQQTNADTGIKYRPMLTDRQVEIFRRDMASFGFPCTFDQIKEIAVRVSAGNPNMADPIDRILIKQIDEAMECAKAGRRPR